MTSPLHSVLERRREAPLLGLVLLSAAVLALVAPRVRASASGPAVDPIPAPESQRDAMHGALPPCALLDDEAVSLDPPCCAAAQEQPPAAAAPTWEKTAFTPALAARGSARLLLDAPKLSPPPRGHARRCPSAR